ncbi:hypothetical protein [Absidia glauca]|uniref:CCHC-type domain-containing protein n=1 Tax=Absidia glauca TaxID=4829 RepID=A0A163K8W8_ABSGL|nr:hypothetical protein [Absidia glauca]
MPLHCRYCHQPNHSRLDWTVRAAIRCWSCLTTGHLRKHCPLRSQQTSNPGPSSKPSPKSKPKPAKNQPISASGSPPKRPPPTSDSESEPAPPRSSRPPPLKQPRPDLGTEQPMAMEIEKSPSSSSQPPQSPPGPDSFLDKALKKASPDAFARCFCQSSTWWITYLGS